MSATYPPALLNWSQVQLLIHAEMRRLHEDQENPKADLLANAVRLQALRWVLDLPKTEGIRRTLDQTSPANVIDLLGIQ